MSGNLSIHGIISAPFLPKEVNEYIEDANYRGMVSPKGLKYRLLLITTIGQFFDMSYRTLFYLRQFVIETGDYVYFKPKEYYNHYNSVIVVFISYVIKVMSICYEIIKGFGYSMVICSLTAEAFFNDPLKAALRVRCLYDQLKEVDFLAWEKAAEAAPSPIAENQDSGPPVTTNSLEGQRSSNLSSRIRSIFSRELTYNKCMWTPFSGDLFLPNELFTRRVSS